MGQILGARLPYLNLITDRLLYVAKRASKNDVLALPLFEKGCDLGRLWGCVRAGELYRDGAGTAQNLERAKDLLRKACSGPQIDQNNNGANGAVEEGCRALSALMAK